APRRNRAARAARGPRRAGVGDGPLPRRLGAARAARPGRALLRDHVFVGSLRGRDARAHRASDHRRGARMRALITGITGQDGSYLAELLLWKGYEVGGVVRRSSTEKFDRIETIRSKITILQADIHDQTSMIDALKAFRPRELYHLAAQSFVPTSWSQPVLTG